MNKLSKFWQELKRRKVVRVITVYAAAAFVILEFVDIVSPSLRLPEWTMNFILVLLTVGFIIAVILSWIFDVHPEEGIVKTEPAPEAKKVDIPPSSNSWRFASYISFVVIVGLVILNVIPRSNNRKVLEKSIAVLPFINDSPDKENAHIIDGYMTAISDNLSKIKDLRVISRSSVEKYRNNPISNSEIAKEQNVSYLLTAFGQKLGDNIRLTVQLDDANGNLIWSNPYDRKISSVGDHISLQSDIAKLVATEIEAIITPEEKQLIEKIPTISLTAYDFYQRGREEHWKFSSDIDNREALERAEDHYHEALEYDSTFALAYTGLARAYWDGHYWETYFSEEFLDSVMILSDIALSLDDQIAEVYTLRGDYYREKGFIELAIIDYDKAIRLNPNDWKAYSGIGSLYINGDGVKALENSYKAASLNHGSELPTLLRLIAQVYYSTGFIVKGNNYTEDALKLDGDSSVYYSLLCNAEWIHGNYTNSIEFGEKGYAMDSTDIRILDRLGLSYMFLGHNEESFKYYKKYAERLNELEIFDIDRRDRLGYVYEQNGFKEEAEYYFNEQIEYSNRIIELGRLRAQSLGAYNDLAGVYAFKDMKDKAYENLRIYNQRKTMPRWAVTMIKDDPLFNSIRDEPEFQQIVRDIESKYQAEHERVRQWLEANDIL